jgi:hypothetical protein
MWDLLIISYRVQINFILRGKVLHIVFNLQFKKGKIVRLTHKQMFLRSSYKKTVTNDILVIGNKILSMFSYWSI